MTHGRIRKAGHTRTAHREKLPPLVGSPARGIDRFWLVLLLVPPLLLFPRLGEIYLWQDEAETAMIGRAILEHGYPLATVGRNIITDQPGQVDLNSAGVWIYTPWLPGYVAALSFALFGASTWSARLPFALLAWGILFVQYGALRDVTRDRRLSRLATVFILGSVPFLLHARQCRYYMLLLLFTLLHLWGYMRLSRRKAGGMGLFLAGGIGLCYSWYPQAIASTIAMGFHALLYHRKSEFLRRFAIGCTVIGSISLPYFLYTRGWSRDYLGNGHNYDSVWRYLGALRAYLLQVHAYCWPGLLALPLLWRHISGPNPARRRARRRRVTFFALLWLATVCAPPGALVLSLMGASLVALGAEMCFYFIENSGVPHSSIALREEFALVVIFLSVSVALITGLSYYPFYRYFLALLPVFAVTTAATVLGVAAGRMWIASLLTTCLLVCNLFQLGPFSIATAVTQVAGRVSDEDFFTSFGYQPNNINATETLRLSEPFPRFHSLAWDYLQELTHEYVGPIGGAVRYLRAQARPGEVIVTTYEHFPLMFYTDLKVYSSHVSIDIGELPEWVLIHGAPGPIVPDRLVQALQNPEQYQRIEIPAHDFAWENIPEPNLHKFRTIVDGPPVVLFHRVGPDLQK